MNDTLHLTFLLLFNCVSQEKSLYTTISVDEIAKALKETYNITIGRRQVFSCLKNLTNRGYIARAPQFKRISTGRIAGISSIITITIKGAIYLWLRQVEGAKELVEKTK